MLERLIHLFKMLIRGKSVAPTGKPRRAQLKRGALNAL